MRKVLPFVVVAALVWVFLPGVSFQSVELPEVPRSPVREVVSVTMPSPDHGRRNAAVYRRLAGETLANPRASKADREKAREYLKRAEALERR